MNDSEQRADRLDDNLTEPGEGFMGRGTRWQMAFLGLSLAMLLGFGLCFSWRFQYSVFAGDMGVKWLQGSTVASGSLALPYPGWKYDPKQIAFPFDPPLVVHGAKGPCSLYLNLMVLGIGPLVDKIFGALGFLLPPLLGGLLATLGLVRLGQCCHLPNPRLAAALTLWSSPLLFYSLILWEHTLAAAAAIWGLVFLYRAPRMKGGLLASALLIGLSSLFRTECGLAVMIMGAFLFWDQRQRYPVKQVLIGLLWCPVLPLLWGRFIAVWSGIPSWLMVTYPYFSGFSPWQEAGLQPHLLKVSQMIAEPWQDMPLMGMLPVVGWFFAGFAGYIKRFRKSLYGSIYAGVYAAASLCFALWLAWQQWHYGPPWFSGVLAACPCLALLPFARANRRWRPLLHGWLAGFLLMLILAPNNGGLQRSTRFLLLFICLGVFWLWSAGINKAGHAWMRRALLCLLLLGFWGQAWGVYFLWNHHAAKEACLERMLKEKPAAILTSVWYFPQEAGRIYHELPMLWPRTMDGWDECLRNIARDEGANEILAVMPRGTRLPDDFHWGVWSAKLWGKFGELPVYELLKTGLRPEKNP